MGEVREVDVLLLLLLLLQEEENEVGEDDDDGEGDASERPGPARMTACCCSCSVTQRNATGVLTRLRFTRPVQSVAFLSFFFAGLKESTGKISEKDLRFFFLRLFRVHYRP